MSTREIKRGYRDHKDHQVNTQDHQLIITGVDHLWSGSSGSAPSMEWAIRIIGGHQDHQGPYKAATVRALWAVKGPDMALKGFVRLSRAL